MRALYKRSVEARELPSAWREEGQFAPDQRVTVYIEPEDAELAQAATLVEVMNIIGRRAQARGLTEDKLQDLLNGA